MEHTTRRNQKAMKNKVLKMFSLTNKFISAKLLMMKRVHKKTVTAFLPVPLFFAVTFCCCLERDASAHENKVSTEHHQKVEKSEHSEHQHDSQGDDECSCAKHFSFLSEQSPNIVFDSSLSQMLAKNFTANFQFENIFLLASLSKHSQGPPLQDHRDYVSLPIYLKISNLRI